jgi:cell shape-determining protein MreC
MFIFDITPAWIFHTLFYLSLVAMILGFVFGKAKLIKQYALMLKISGVLGFVIATFLEGAMYDYNVMQARIEEAKQQTAEYEQKNKELNDKLAKKSSKVKEKIQVKKEYITRYIDREVKKYDNTCVIPKPFIDAHNQSAEKAK